MFFRSLPTAARALTAPRLAALCAVLFVAPSLGGCDSDECQADSDCEEFACQDGTRIQRCITADCDGSTCKRCALGKDASEVCDDSSGSGW